MIFHDKVSINSVRHYCRPIVCGILSTRSLYWMFNLDNHKHFDYVMNTSYIFNLYIIFDLFLMNRIDERKSLFIHHYISLFQNTMNIFLASTQREYYYVNLAFSTELISIANFFFNNKHYLYLYRIFIIIFWRSYVWLQFFYYGYIYSGAEDYSIVLKHSMKIIPLAMLTYDSYIFKKLVRKIT